MSVKNTNALVLSVLLFFSVPAVADSYIGVFLIRPYDSGIEQPAVSPTHPVDHSLDSRDPNNGIGYSISVGHRWEYWYTAVAWTDINNVTALTFRSGEDATNNYQTSARRIEDTSAIAVKLGRTFSLAPDLFAFIEAGAHYYEQEVATRTDTIQTPKLGGARTITSATVSDTERDTAFLYGAGIGLDLGDGYRAVLGITEYDGSDLGVVRAGVQIAF